MPMPPSLCNTSEGFARADYEQNLWKRCLSDALEEQLVQIRMLLHHQQEVLIHGMSCRLKDRGEDECAVALRQGFPLASPRSLPKPGSPPDSFSCTPSLLPHGNHEEVARDLAKVDGNVPTEDVPQNEFDEKFSIDDSDEGTFSKDAVDMKDAKCIMDRTRSSLMMKLLGTNTDNPSWVFPLDLFICAIIVANASVIFTQTHYKGWLTARDLGLESDDTGWGNAELWFESLDHVFNIIYILELILRLSYYRCSYFKDKSNVFDACIVLVTSVDAYILGPLFQTKAVQGLTIARMVRVFRLGRVIRIFKMLRFAKNLTELRVMLRTISSSARALFWSMVFLGVTLLGAGMAINQILLTTIGESGENIEDGMRHWVYRYYGTGARASYTMFEATFSGCWPTYARPLIEEVNGLFAIFFIVYNVAVTFAILRIIGAIFLNETIKAANKDSETLVLAKIKEKETLKQNLQEFFHEADTSGDGLLSFNELATILNNTKVQAWLEVLELEVYELNALFQLLDDNGDGEVSLEEFLGGAMRLKGEARQLDSIALMHEQNKIKDRLTQMSRSLDRVSEHLFSRSDEGVWWPSQQRLPRHGVSMNDNTMPMALNGS